MNVTSTLININSANPQALYEWYRDVLGLPVQEGMGETAVQAGGVAITFDGHSEISGPAKEPARYLVNFFVDDAAAETERIEKAGVSCIRRLGQEFWGGIISTFVVVQLLVRRGGPHTEHPHPNGCGAAGGAAAVVPAPAAHLHPRCGCGHGRLE